MAFTLPTSVKLLVFAGGVCLTTYTAAAFVADLLLGDPLERYKRGMEKTSIVDKKPGDFISKKDIDAAGKQWNTKLIATESRFEARLEKEIGELHKSVSKLESEILKPNKNKGSWWF